MVVGVAVTVVVVGGVAVTVVVVGGVAVAVAVCVLVWVDVCVFVADWVEESIAGVVALPFDPPLSFPTDLASCWPPTDGAESLVAAARRVRDAEGWLTHRAARTELPTD